MTEYTLVKIMNDGLIGVRSSEHGRQLFSSRKLRKARRCSFCGIEIPKGAVAWGDAVSCAANRMERLHEGCITGLKRAGV